MTINLCVIDLFAFGMINEGLMALIYSRQTFQKGRMLSKYLKNHLSLSIIEINLLTTPIVLAISGQVPTIVYISKPTTKV